MSAIDTYTIAPLSASLAVVAACVIITLVGIKMLKGFMAEDAAKAEISNK